MGWVVGEMMRERGAESAAPPPSGVSLDQHAASLTALASLLGYLEFSPSISIAPATDADKAQRVSVVAHSPRVVLSHSYARVWPHRPLQPFRRRHLVALLLGQTPRKPQPYPSPNPNPGRRPATRGVGGGRSTRAASTRGRVACAGGGAGARYHHGHAAVGAGAAAIRMHGRERAARALLPRRSAQV
jgi:hypothetical protein